MTAATVTTADPGAVYAEENVVLTVSDGETYTSKLGKPIIAQLTWLEAVTLSTLSQATSCTISGSTITIDADGVTDKKAALTVKGYK